MARNSKNRLERWEIALVKAMIAATPRRTDQDILAYFTRPTRSINHGRIKDIRDQTQHANVAAASSEQLTSFLKSWPNLDASGLHLVGDELLIKAREAILHAVRGFNNPQIYFKAEIFIVTAMIAWTYLLHAYFKSKSIDYRYRDKKTSETLKTTHGADKHWELTHCLAHNQCPLDDASKENLKFLVEIRHEIEHQMTRRIDDAVSAKLQACCLNFNRTIKTCFGEEYGLDKDLGIALQFAGIQRDQRDLLLKDLDLPPNFLAAYISHENALSDELIRDPRYAYRVAYVERSVNSRGMADQVIEFIRPESEEGQGIARLLLKETERKKFKPKAIVQLMKKEGHRDFDMHKHQLLWQAIGAKNPTLGFGIELRPGDWWWYERWIDYVRTRLTQPSTAPT